MYECSTDILDQARFVTVWTRFAHEFHTIICRLQYGQIRSGTVKYGIVRSSTFWYGLVRLNTRFTRHSLGLHTVPSSFVRGMLELSYTRVCFQIKWLILMTWHHKCSNFKDAMSSSFRSELFTSYILTIFKRRNILP